MAVVPIISQGREVLPGLLDRPVCLEVCNQQEEELLHIERELPQTALDLPLDLDLIFHSGDNITTRAGTRKSYRKNAPHNLSLASAQMRPTNIISRRVAEVAKTERV